MSERFTAGDYERASKEFTGIKVGESRTANMLRQAAETERERENFCPHCAQHEIDELRADLEHSQAEVERLTKERDDVIDAMTRVAHLANQREQERDEARRILKQQYGVDASVVIATWPKD